MPNSSNAGNGVKRFLEFDAHPKLSDVLHDLGRRELRELAKDRERTTVYGSASYVSRVRSRSAPLTRSAVDGELTAEDHETVEKVKQYIAHQRMICVDRKLCTGGRGQSYGCRLFVTDKYPQLALMFRSSLAAPTWLEDPDFVLFDIPEWPQTTILADTENGVTYVLGSDYYGEVKKGFLRMLMYRAKQLGNLGLHAGSKDYWARSKRTGEIERNGMLFFGLSGTGKTTLTAHDFHCDATQGERVAIRQDDVVLLRSNGTCLGSEERGFYIKTEGLTPETQYDLWRATTSPEAVLENVWVDEAGNVDFCNTTQYTANGRAVVQVKDIAHADDDRNLAAANRIFFITRHPLSPAICRLSHEQAACAFMLGESVRTSADSADAQNEPIRVVGTNPFITGPKHEEGNMFLDILRKNPNIECFLLNTGFIGDGPDAIKVDLETTCAIIRDIAREGITWVEDPRLGVKIPAAVDGIDIGQFDLARVIRDPAELERRLADLRAERLGVLKGFPGLYPEILEAVY